MHFYTTGTTCIVGTIQDHRFIILASKQLVEIKKN